MIRAFQFYWKPGTPSSVEGFINFHVDDAVKDMTFIDGTRKMVKQSYTELAYELECGFKVKTTHSIMTNSDTTVKITEAFESFGWQVKEMFYKAPKTIILQCAHCYGTGLMPTDVNFERVDCYHCNGTGIVEEYKP